jgi:hypothetical protein
MTRFARVRVDPWGEEHEVGTGAIVGRSLQHAVAILDRRISEVHAFVSERDRLWLMPARGALYIEGAKVEHAELKLGARVQLTADGEVSLVVVHTSGTRSSLGLRWRALGPVPLGGRALWFCPERSAWLTPADGAPPEDRAAELWPGDGRWFLQRPTGRAEVVEVGRTWVFGGDVLEAVAIVPDPWWTRATDTRRTVLRILPSARGETVEITHHAGGTSRTAVLTGKLGALVREVLRSPEPVPWTEIARRPSLWGNLRPPHDNNWHNALSRLRRVFEQELGLELDDVLDVPLQGHVRWRTGPRDRIEFEGPPEGGPPGVTGEGGGS